MKTIVAIFARTGRTASDRAPVPGGMKTCLAAGCGRDGAPVYKLNFIFPQGRLEPRAHADFTVLLPPCGAIWPAIAGDGPQLIIVKARMDNQDIQPRLQPAQSRKVIFLQVVR